MVSGQRAIRIQAGLKQHSKKQKKKSRNSEQKPCLQVVTLDRSRADKGMGWVGGSSGSAGGPGEH